MFVGFVASTSKEKMQVRKNEATQDVLTWKLQKEHCRRHEFPKKYVIIIFSRRYEVIWKRFVTSTSCVSLDVFAPVKQEHEEVAEKWRRYEENSTCICADTNAFDRRFSIVNFPLASCEYLLSAVESFCRLPPSQHKVKQRFDARMIREKWRFRRAVVICFGWKRHIPPAAMPPHQMHRISPNCPFLWHPLGRPSSSMEK